MSHAPAFTITVRSYPAPYQLDARCSRSKYVVGSCLDVGSNIRSDMYVNGAVVGEELTRKSQSAADHIHIAVEASSPRIAIGFLLYDGLFFGDLDISFANLCLEGEIGSCQKWRVDVDEIDFPCELLQQGPHHEEVVAPDELVFPSRLEGVTLFALVNIKECSFEPVLLHLTCRAAFLHGLDDLKGQIHSRHLFASAVLVVFARPDQFGLCDLDLCHTVTVLHE